MIHCRSAVAAALQDTTLASVPGWCPLLWAEMDNDMDPDCIATLDCPWMTEMNKYNTEQARALLEIDTNALWYKVEELGIIITQHNCIYTTGEEPHAECDADYWLRDLHLPGLPSHRHLERL